MTQKQCQLPLQFSRINIMDILHHISIIPFRLSFSSNILLNFFSKQYIPPLLEEIFEFMYYCKMHLQVKKLNVDIFALNPQQIPAPSLPSKWEEFPSMGGITHSLGQRFVSKIYSPPAKNLGSGNYEYSHRKVTSQLICQASDFYIMAMPIFNRLMTRSFQTYSASKM